VADGRRVCRDVSYAYPTMLKLLRAKEPSKLKACLWAWPTLKQANHCAKSTTLPNQSLITFNASEDKILITDFDKWHYQFYESIKRKPNMLIVDSIDCAQVVLWEIRLDSVISIKPINK